MKKMKLIIGIFFILVLTLFTGCKEKTISEIIQEDKELIEIISANPNYNIEEQKIISKEELIAFQKKDDELSKWYKQIPSNNYLQLLIKINDNKKFLVLINPEMQKVEQILGLINVNIK